MTRKSALALFSLLAICAHSASVDAATRTFFAPDMDGDRISACIGEGTICGKPVADRLCSGRGFSQALTYQLTPNTAEQLRLRTIDNKLSAATSSEPAFAFVKCYSPNA